MANYYGQGRTNYFGVKDPDAFEAWCDSLNLTCIDDQPDGPEGVTLYGFTTDMLEDGLPGSRYNEETEEFDDVDVADELAAHLQEGYVAVFQSTGAEKMRYVMGIAWAVNSAGDTVFISLDDIFEKAKHLGHTITDCAY